MVVRNGEVSFQNLGQNSSGFMASETKWKPADTKETIDLEWWTTSSHLHTKLRMCRLALERWLLLSRPGDEATDQNRSNSGRELKFSSQRLCSMNHTVVHVFCSRAFDALCCPLWTLKSHVHTHVDLYTQFKIFLKRKHLKEVKKQQMVIRTHEKQSSPTPV